MKWRNGGENVNHHGIVMAQRLAQSIMAAANGVAHGSAKRSRRLAWAANVARKRGVAKMKMAAMASMAAGLAKAGYLAKCIENGG